MNEAGNKCIALRHAWTMSETCISMGPDFKQQFQTILSHNIEELNVFIYDQEETDIGWLLSVAMQADVTVIDIDNCDSTTKLFVTFLLAQPNTHYITNDEITPYGLISKNRIYNLDAIVASMTEEDEEEDEDIDDESKEEE